jgi:DNA excision repair protein ERCC-2
MGGIFGEGIDLVGNSLSAAVVVGPGLPPPDPERELLRGYFETTLGRGFDFAYTFPGWNRVLQAAGRVIRSETDRGAVLLIDDRFNSYGYRKMFPPEWKDIHVLQDPADLRALLREHQKNGEVEKDTGNRYTPRHP